MRLLPVWHQILNELKLRPRIGLCLRNPTQVARSLEARNGLDPRVGEYRWLNYMSECFQYCRGIDICVIEYEAWFDDPTRNLAKLRDLIGLPVDVYTDVPISDIVEPQLRHDDPRLVEAWQPLVRSVYELARRAGDDPAAREQVEGLASQFLGFQQLRAFQRTFEHTTALAQRLPSVEREAAALRKALLARRSEQKAGELAALRADLAERDADLAEATERAARDAEFAELARRADEAAVRRPSSRDLIALEWAGTPRPNFWQRLHSALGVRQAAKRQAADRAAAELAILRGALAEREDALGDAAGQIEEMAAQLQGADAERADAEAAVARAERDAPDRRSAVAVVEAQLIALRANLAGREDALCDATGRAKEMAARLAVEQTERVEIEGALARAREEAAKRDATVKAAEAALAALRAELANRENAFNEQSARSEETAARLQRVLTERGEADAALVRVQQEAAERETVASVAITTLRATAAEREDALAEATGDVKEVTARLAAAEAALAERDTALASLQSEVAEREGALAEATGRAEEMAVRSEAAEAELTERDATAHTRFARLREELAVRSAGLVEAADRVEEMKAELAERDTVLASLQSEVAEHGECALAEAVGRAKRWRRGWRRRGCRRLAERDRALALFRVSRRRARGALAVATGRAERRSADSGGSRNGQTRHRPSRPGCGVDGSRRRTYSKGRVAEVTGRG